MSDEETQAAQGPIGIKNKSLQQAFAKMQALLAEGSRDKAIDNILAFKADGDVTRYTLIRVLISIGQENGDERLTDCALEAFEKIKSKAPSDPSFWYDIANGYQTIYELRVVESAGNPFDNEAVVNQALKYFGKASKDGPRAATNLGNLYDSIGRPVEAIDCYERAMKLDPTFGMAIGNKGLTVEHLSPIATYPVTFQIYAHQLYQEALQHEVSIREVGGDGALAVFKDRDEALLRAFTTAGKSALLEQDLRHKHYDESALSKFVGFYTDFCVRHGLYLNLHIYDQTAAASIGDTVIPRFVTDTADGAFEYVNDIAFRLNEISESYMTARLALAQSQFINDDSSAISKLTTLINLNDHSASNIYVGYLKMAYKEAFSVLDKIAVLLNHYLGLGLREDSCYYRSVWYVHDEFGKPLESKAVAPQVKTQGYRLFGLYLLCHELCGSKYSHVRNALTHRYLRVYREVSGPKGTFTFEELTHLTIEALYKIKCAVMYVSLFIQSSENAKRSREPSERIGQMPLSTEQHIDQW